MLYSGSLHCEVPGRIPLQEGLVSRQESEHVNMGRCHSLKEACELGSES